jgi:SH3-like domain-containing protein
MHAPHPAAIMGEHPICLQNVAVLTTCGNIVTGQHVVDEQAKAGDCRIEAIGFLLGCPNNFSIRMAASRPKPTPARHLPAAGRPSDEPPFAVRPALAQPRCSSGSTPASGHFQPMNRRSDMIQWRSLRLALALTATCCVMVSSAQALCVTSPQANLRAGPGTRYQKTWEVYQYMPLQRIGQRGNWLQVKDVDGDRHWVHRRLVGKRSRCAVVKANTANVRSGPGTTYRQTDWSPIVRYYSLQVVKRSGRWLKVRDEVGNLGWIARSLLWER